MLERLVSRSFPLVVCALALATVTACGEDGVEPPPAPKVLDRWLPRALPGAQVQPPDRPGTRKLGLWTRTLTILYTNDEHAQLLGYGPEVDDYPTATAPGSGVRHGGIARRATVLAQERAAAKAAGGDTLTVSAGDISMGTLAQVGFTSGTDYRILKALGYDAVCLGNHELDLGTAALAQAIGAAVAAGGAPQVVASNLHFSATDPGDDQLAALYGSGSKAKAMPITSYHVIKTGHGIRVGLVGVLGAEAAYNASFKAPLQGSGLPEEEADFAAVRKKIVADLQPVVDTLRDDHKVDLVIALSHGGVNLEQPALGDDHTIAQQVRGIDVIVSGHTHTVVKAPIVTKGPDGRSVLTVQAGSSGQLLGRLVLTIDAKGVAFDHARSRLIPITDTIVPDPAAAKLIDSVIQGAETALGRGPSFLERALSRITGAQVKDDPATLGDLYFYKLGQTSYSIPGLKPFVETNLLNLATDSELAASIAALRGEPPTIAVQAAGQVRADLEQGATGEISFADAYRVFPLGFSPFDGSLGYPLTHYYVYLVELKAALEMAASLGLVLDSFYLGASGLRVTVETTRAPFDETGDPTDPQNGRVTRIEWDSQRRVGAEQYDVVLFDAARTEPWASSAGGPTTLFHVVTDLYLAAGVSSFGVTIKDKDSQLLSLDKAVIRRADGSELKTYEAFAGYLRSLGTLPDRYNGAAAAGKLPRRNLCAGPACGSY